MPRRVERADPDSADDDNIFKNDNSTLKAAQQSNDERKLSSTTGFQLLTNGFDKNSCSQTLVARDAEAGLARDQAFTNTHTYTESDLASG